MHSNRPKWNERFVFLAYDLAKSGASDAAIAASLGISHSAMHAWKRTRPLFATALREGVSRRSKPDETPQTFFEYLHDRLPDELRELWDEIDLCQTESNGIKRMENLFRMHGLRTRQHFFLHALARSLFNHSEACRFVGISRRTLYKWINEDPDFAALMDEIHWHKGNFFENQLLKQVEAGETLAVIHVNKTFNKDRGYGPTVKFEGDIKHEHRHLHASIDLDKLDLPLEVRKTILKAYRVAQEQQGGTLILERGESA